MDFDFNDSIQKAAQSRQEGAESLYVLAGLADGEKLRENPWKDVTSGRTAEKPTAQQDETGKAEKPIQQPAQQDVYRRDLPEKVRRVQDAIKSPLENTLYGKSPYEKNLVVGMQNGIIAADLAGFKYNLSELLHSLSVQGRGADEKTEIVREDLKAIERTIRQNCSADISLDYTNDGRTIIRTRPDTVALELSQNGDKVKRVEDAGNGILLMDNSKEVIRPTTAELARAIAEKCTNSRQW